MYISRSYSRPKTFSSHAIDFCNEVIACLALFKLPLSTKISSATLRPDEVIKLSSNKSKSPATRANK